MPCAEQGSGAAGQCHQLQCPRSSRAAFVTDWAWICSASSRRAGRYDCKPSLPSGTGSLLLSHLLLHVFPSQQLPLQSELSALDISQQLLPGRAEVAPAPKHCCTQLSSAQPHKPDTNPSQWDWGKCKAQLPRVRTSQGSWQLRNYPSIHSGSHQVFLNRLNPAPAYRKCKRSSMLLEIHTISVISWRAGTKISAFCS